MAYTRVSFIFDCGFESCQVTAGFGNSRIRVRNDLHNDFAHCFLSLEYIYLHRRIKVKRCGSTSLLQIFNRYCKLLAGRRPEEAAYARRPAAAEAAVWHGRTKSVKGSTYRPRPQRRRYDHGGGICTTTYCGNDSSGVVRPHQKRQRQ